MNASQDQSNLFCEAKNLLSLLHIRFRPWSIHALPVDLSLDVECQYNLNGLLAIMTAWSFSPRLTGFWYARRYDHVALAAMKMQASVTPICYAGQDGHT